MDHCPLTAQTLPFSTLGKRQTYTVHAIAIGYAKGVAILQPSLLKEAPKAYKIAAAREAACSLRLLRTGHLHPFSKAITAREGAKGLQGSRCQRSCLVPASTSDWSSSSIFKAIAARIGHLHPSSKSKSKSLAPAEHLGPRLSWGHIPSPGPVCIAWVLQYSVDGSALSTPED